jgi:hypothetical protein
VTDKLWTISEVAKLIAYITDDTVGAEEYWTRIFRTYHTAGLLPAVAYEGRGKTAPAIYDESGVCLARLTAALMRDIKLENRHVREILSSLQQDGGEFHISKAIAGMRAGDEWLFRIEVFGSDPDNSKMLGGFRPDTGNNDRFFASARKGGFKGKDDPVARMEIPSSRLRAIFDELISL